MIVRFSRHGAGDNSPYAQEPCEVESLKHGFVAEVRRETVSPTVTGPPSGCQNNWFKQIN